MAVNLEVESRELIDLVGVEFNAIQRLFSDKKFSAAAKGIASMMSRLLKLRTVNETLVISMIYDLDIFKKEIENNLSRASENSEIYFSLIQEDILRLKQAIYSEYPGKAKIDPKLSIGAKELTYGRIMDEKEFKEIMTMSALRSRVPGELVPTFEAPPKIVKFFMETITRDKAHNLIQALGGSGNAHWIVIFTTRFNPVSIMPSKHLPQIREAKFVNGTPVKIFVKRRI